MIQLEAEEIMHLKVECSEPLEVKEGIDGYLRVIPIRGGTFEGRIKGTIVNGGADWNTLKPGNYAHAFAKYLLLTEDGEYIAVENEGILEEEDTRLIKTRPRFTADSKGRYGWLNRGVYVGSLKPGEGRVSVEITIYRLL